MAKVSKSKIRHRVFMPPTMPKVPKKPVFPKYRTAPKSDGEPAKVWVFDNGPWHGLSARLTIPKDQSTMVIRVGEFNGRYHRPASNNKVLEWQSV